MKEIPATECRVIRSKDKDQFELFIKYEDGSIVNKIIGRYDILDYTDLLMFMVKFTKNRGLI